jgi:hypothetical protein
MVARGRFREGWRRSCARWPNTRKRAPARKHAAKPAKRTTARRTRTHARPRRRRSYRRRGGIVAPLGFSLPRGLPRLPDLDQRQRDVIGLALVAAGIFMGFVLYGGIGMAGVRATGWRSALGWALGKARVLAPIALVGGGGALLLRPVLAGAASVAHRRDLFVRLDRARAGRRNVRRELGGGWGLVKGRVVDLGLFAGARRRRGRGALPGVAPVGAERGCGHTRGLPVPDRRDLLTGASLASAIRATGSGVATRRGC